MDEIENAWEYLNEYISSMYSDCSSLPELIDGFGVRKDGKQKELWEVIKDGLEKYDKDIGRL
jgi:hypothetical protein